MNVQSTPTIKSKKFLFGAVKTANVKFTKYLMKSKDDTPDKAIELNVRAKKTPFGTNCKVTLRIGYYYDEKQDFFSRKNFTGDESTAAAKAINFINEFIRYEDENFAKYVSQGAKLAYGAIGRNLPNIEEKVEEADNCARFGLYYRAGTLLMEAYKEIDTCLPFANDSAKKKLETMREKLINAAVGRFDNEIMEGGRGDADVYRKMAECCSASKTRGNEAFAKRYAESADELQTAETEKPSSAAVFALCRMERKLNEQRYDKDDEGAKGTIQAMVDAIVNLPQESVGERGGWLKLKIFRLIEGKHGITDAQLTVLKAAEERLGIVDVPVPG